MLRLRHTVLGQYRAPYQTDIENIARGFPACFTSMSILPALDRAIADGKVLQQQYAANAPIISFSSTSGNIGDAIAQAQSLRNRYNSEDPNTKYCNNDLATAAQHYRTVQAFAGIYQNAAGAQAAFDTLNAANAQLLQDLNPINALPNLLPGVPSIPAWAQWLIGGVVVFSLYKSLK